jgi:hypothetical protein
MHPKRRRHPTRSQNRHEPPTMIELVSSVIGPIDQDTANANGAHFSEGGDRLVP